MILSLFDVFRTPSAREIAQRQLEYAERELLEAHAGAEFATAMVQCHADRIKRLQATLGAKSSHTSSGELP